MFWLRLDFQASAGGPLAAGAQSALPVAFAPGGWGYLDPAGVSAFDRGGAYGVSEPAFWQDGHTGSAPAKYAVTVPTPGGSYAVRVYGWDPATSPSCKVQTEAGDTHVVAPGPAYTEMVAADKDNDGVLVLTFWPTSPSGGWVVNGLDVVELGALPPPRN